MEPDKASMCHQCGFKSHKNVSFHCVGPSYTGCLRTGHSTPGMVSAVLRGEGSPHLTCWPYLANAATSYIVRQKTTQTRYLRLCHPWQMPHLFNTCVNLSRENISVAQLWLLSNHVNCCEIYAFQVM